ncbi:hypothetical protein ZPAH1_orf00208 [Aeromonas phage ZPAH1]|nr:hypothetical protein ASwh1_159 [Aeromonas phage Aswh_1]QQG33970.1 hypothetical protein ZPAH1_orf00208 [Aeromonas phage ZPAH1]
MHLLHEPHVSLQNDTDKKYDLEEFKAMFLFQPVSQATIQRMKDFLNHRKNTIIENGSNPYYDMDCNSMDFIINDIEVSARR